MRKKPKLEFINDTTQGNAWWGAVRMWGSLLAFCLFFWFIIISWLGGA